MRRSWSVRLATALLAVCSGLTPLEGATVSVCPTPDMPMPGMAHADHSVPHAAHADGAPASHHGPAHRAGGVHGCTCPGACASGASALPAAPSVPGGTGACSPIPASTPSGDVACRGAADHFLPFPSGPPSA